MNRRGNLKNNIWVYRKKRGFTQKYLAQLLGHKDQTQICRWEKGNKIPNLQSVIDLAIALRTPVEFLFAHYSQTSREIIRGREDKISNITSQYE